MNDDRRARLEAGRALAREHARPETLAVFEHNGYSNGTPIMVALPDDLLADVMQRCRAVAPPVVVAIYEPSRDADDPFRYVTFGPGKAANAEPGDDHVGDTVTISMLADYIERRGRMYTFKMVPGASSVADARAKFGVDVDRVEVFAGH